MRKIALLAVFALIAFAYLLFWMPNTFDEDCFVIVSRGESFHQITDSLEVHGVLRSKALFSLAARILGRTNTIQIGKYRFRSGMSNVEILQDLRSGSSVEWITVIVPEGLRAQQQARIFRRNLGINSARFMTLVKDSVYVSSAGIHAASLEGYLFHSTYHFYWQAGESEIIKTMLDHFWKFYNDSLRPLLNQNDLSLHEVLSLASIVEWETPIDTERPLIAGVYLNRLQKGMKLQADPTVQYCLPGGRRRLYFSDLKIPSPYNTYLNFGLPPGPVNNPGKASILAALTPAKHKYLYFVADGLGGHSFSTDYAIHKRKAKRYHDYKNQRQENEGERTSKIFN